ncbi:MAG: alanine racemase [Solirubrobacterales bacterium]
MSDQTAPESGLRANCHGVSPLDARLETWQESLLGDSELLSAALGSGESPINVIDPGPMGRNAAELTDAADESGVRLKIFFARKANKCLSLVDRARDLGLGVDLASVNELAEARDRDVASRDLVVTAAVKPRPLLELCVETGALVVLDNQDEADLLAKIAAERNQTVRVAIRLAVEIPDAIPTRFGLPPAEAKRLAETIGSDPHLDLAGLHFHLDGYSGKDRVLALAAALDLADDLPAESPMRFIDIGGGIPMSYLDGSDQWDRFWVSHREALLGDRPPLTFANHGLGFNVADGQITGGRATYPYFQEPTRGDWLRELLASEISLRSSGSSTVASALRSRDLELRCEPGRSLLDGCGLTAARVHFVKRRLDGETLIGLGMNRTQCRSTSDDFMVDPILLPAPGSERSGELSGYLVGAYCIERELITLRRLVFPFGAGPGDIVVFPNTAGYLMHILESSSHRMPLAENFVRADGQLGLDPVDVQ